MSHLRSFAPILPGPRHVRSGVICDRVEPAGSPTIVRSAAESGSQFRGAMLRAAKLVEPALDELYAMLSSEQKARFNTLQQVAGPWGRRRILSLQLRSGRTTWGEVIALSQRSTRICVSGPRFPPRSAEARDSTGSSF
nr:Spy/CpxP family protein refolding chaperone [Bradyrhizobium sp. CCBAU 11361]